MAYKNTILTTNNVSSQNNVKYSQFYKGFSTAVEGTLSTKMFDYDLVKQDLINQFQTRKGERVMNPAFGTIIWDVIFDPFTSAVKQAIVEDVTRILNSDPRAIPTNITILETDTGMVIDVTLYYVLTNQSEQMKFDFNRKTGIASV